MSTESPVNAIIFANGDPAIKSLTASKSVWEKSLGIYIVKATHLHKNQSFGLFKWPYLLFLSHPNDVLL